MEIKQYNEYTPLAKEVREKVFITEQGFSYDYDKTDDVATHFVAFDGEKPVGACRVFEDSEAETYVLGRLAVLKGHRFKGIGRMLIDSAKEFVKQKGGNFIILHSQIQAKQFYLKTGFVVFSGIEYEEDRPHIWMGMELE